MDFTKQMFVIMETIWHLRTTTRKKKLAHTDVEKHSGNFTEDKKPVSRQIWYSAKSRSEWQDIRKAIEGQLPPGHPVEQTIAMFGKGDMTGLFAAGISEMASETERLKAELEEERKKHKEFIERIHRDQYEESHFRVNFEYWKTLAENLQKEHHQDAKTIRNYQTENIRLRDENAKFRKKVAVMGAVENPHYQLFQPDMRKVCAELSDKELLQAYQRATGEAFDKMKAAMEKKPPEDIFFIFHAFNVDIEQFVATELPFKFSDNNYVFACCDLSATSRKNLYGEIARALDLIKPTVILVCGIGESADAEKPSNVIELSGARSSQEMRERLRVIVEKFRRVDFDVVHEGYDTVVIRRF